MPPFLLDNALANRLAESAEALLASPQLTQVHGFFL
jgi:hypothetical protein